MRRILITLCSLALLLSLAACGMSARQSAGSSDSANPGQSAGSSDRLIKITDSDGSEVIFELNTSGAADDFYQQLPLSVQIRDYAESEKIFYPPEKLDTSDTPAAQGPAGTLAYYEPWGNVAIFYKECAGAGGLYELGEAVSSTQLIAGMTGEIRIEALAASSSSSQTVTGDSQDGTQLRESSRAQDTTARSTSGSSAARESGVTRMNVQVGGSSFHATLEDNAAARAFVELMREGPVVIRMSDYSGFEKVGALPTGLPASNRQTTTRSGDIVLYNGNQIVIFYGSNSWSYTRLGRIDDLTGWEEALGGGDVTVTFSVD